MLRSACGETPPCTRREGRVGSADVIYRIDIHLMLRDVLGSTRTRLAARLLLLPLSNVFAGGFELPSPPPGMLQRGAARCWGAARARDDGRAEGKPDPARRTRRQDGCPFHRRPSRRVAARFQNPCSGATWAGRQRRGNLTGPAASGRRRFAPTPSSSRIVPTLGRAPA